MASLTTASACRRRPGIHHRIAAARRVVVARPGAREPSSSRRAATGVSGRGGSASRGGGGGLPRLGAAARDLVAPQLSDVEETVIIENEEDSSRIVFRIGGLVDVFEVEDLTEKVGWPRREPHKVKLALENSFMVTALYRQSVAAETGEVEAEKLIGVTRVTSDTVFNATLWDVTIDPAYQGEGLGKTLLEMTIRKLCQLDIRTISLFAEPQVLDFYRKLGFRKDPQGIRAMFWYPRY